MSPTTRASTLDLTAADRERLYGLRRRFVLVAVPVGAVFALVLTFMGRMMAGAGPAQFGFFLLFVALFLGVFTFTMRLAVGGFRRALEAGTKQRVAGVITERRREVASSGSRGQSSSVRYGYVLAFDGLEVGVDEATFAACSVGDSVEVEHVPSLGAVLSFVVAARAPSPEVSASASSPARFEAPMREADLVALRRARARRLRSTLGWGLLFGFIVVFVSAFATLGAVVLFAQRAWGLVLVPPLLPFVYLGLWLYRLARIAWTSHVDLSEQRKAVTRERLEERIQSNSEMFGRRGVVTSSRGEFFYLVLRGELHPVDRGTFERLANVAEVRVHRALRSGVVLEVEPCER